MSILMGKNDDSKIIELIAPNQWSGTMKVQNFDINAHSSIELIDFLIGLKQLNISGTIQENSNPWLTHKVAKYTILSRSNAQGNKSKYLADKN
eukprot:scaffold39684_cov70-Attheya_sp.AAC.1